MHRPSAKEIYNDLIEIEIKLNEDVIRMICAKALHKILLPNEWEEIKKDLLNKKYFTIKKRR